MSRISQALLNFLTKARVITDDLRRLACGNDASFYRMIPEIVAVVESEQEVQALLQAKHDHQRPVTFRAAGIYYQKPAPIQVFGPHVILAHSSKALPVSVRH